MPSADKPPRSVRLCNLMVRVAAPLIPATQRSEWQREWSAEIWHRWQFLYHAGFWNNGEALGLVRNCLGMFPDAIWHFALQDPVQDKIRTWARSPWTCLSGLAGMIVILALFSSGFAATRQLLISGSDHGNDRLLFVWLHPTIGGADKELPPDVPPAWARHSKLLEEVAGFHISRQQVTTPSVRHSAVVISTEPALFKLLRATPAIGSVPSDSGVVLDQLAWKTLFHSKPRIVGSKTQIGKETYTIIGVLPASLDFVTRQPKVFIVNRWLSDRVNVIARVKPGVSMQGLDRELVRIAEDDTYYFFRSQLRMSYLQNALWTPVRLFGVAVLASAFLCFCAARVRIAHIRAAFLPTNRKPAAHRALFFVSKVALGLALVFAAGLEWSRSQSAILFSSRDPGAGPFLLWLYILLGMGVFFWALADQRARCRVCLRLLCFPVRIGCPGCLLLDWSGVELLCTQGHGVLHVPHMAASWEEESQRWIALDESWKGLFAGTD